MKKKIVIFLRRFTWLDWFLLGVFLLSFLYLIFFSWARLHERMIPVEYLAKDNGGVVAGVQSPKVIWVDVGGAVIRPGVYQLNEESRVKDALVAAGGLTTEADRTYVERIMNQAAKLKDGEKVYIPTFSDIETTASNSTNQAIVNINSASASELDKLWGVGVARAEEIIANRPYQSVEELVSKKVITKNVFDRIKDQISVY